LIAAANLDPTQRAETVPVSGFVLLARAYKAFSSEVGTGSREENAPK
jgi:hypothetical protein